MADVCVVVFVAARALMHLKKKDFLEKTKNMVKIENIIIILYQKRKHEIRYQRYFGTAPMPN